MSIYRTLTDDVRRVLGDWRKMAFVSGPRQVGKTTLAKSLLASQPGRYFNWDLASDRKTFARDQAFFEKDAAGDPASRPLVVFDELHKYARWKNYLKGIFDGFSDRFAFMVTGSGRLDVYRRGGDSLLGRYLPLGLFPLTVAELAGTRATWASFQAGLGALEESQAAGGESFASLLRLGGFPEPFLRGREAFHRAWSAGRTERLIREDIRDATRLRELSLVEMLAHLLPERVGSPLSLNSMREDLGVAFETVRAWVGVLDAFYYSFRIPPWTKRVSRALRKETKLYLWDWAEVDGEEDRQGARFENLVALHLLKAVRTWTQMGEARLDLAYIRDKEKREVDFVVTENNQPRVLVECRMSDSQLSPYLLAFQERLNVAYAVQLVRQPGHARRTTIGGRQQWVVSADRWLGKLV
ncbi:MAG: ATP-binding protein [Deltaproteobacteria bacterium]|nr:ATP-binding protein [Deltaproteobacteria bacterium]